MNFDTLEPEDAKPVKAARLTVVILGAVLATALVAMSGFFVIYALVH